MTDLRPAHLRPADIEALRACGAVVRSWPRSEVARLAATTGWESALHADGYASGDAVDVWYDDGGFVVSCDPAARLPWFTAQEARS